MMDELVKILMVIYTPMNLFVAFSIISGAAAGLMLALLLYIDKPDAGNLKETG